MTLVSLFGNTNRFDGVNPRCALAEPANPSAGVFMMRADCMSRGGQTIVALMNDLIAKGIILTTGLEGGIGRCSVSQAITVDPVTSIATIKVDDPNCLRSGANQALGVAKGSQVLLPRFVAYDSDDPRTFHTSMIEPPDGDSPGIGLQMPPKKILQGGGEGEGGERNAVTFDAASSLSTTRSDACGLQSYLATITTEEEHDHLTKTMMTREVPGWQSGYIGARASTYDTFDWVTGPAAERGTFWYGIGVDGLPYLAGSRRQGDHAGRTLFEYDPKPAFGGNRRRLLVQPNRNNESFLFTNWAGGKEYSAERPEEYSCDSQSQSIPFGKCQPSSGMPGEGVAIYGHRNREGTWFSVPTEAQKCDATREHSICGYYVEFEEPEGESPVKFAHQITLDMGRFREFCQSSGATGG